MVFLSHEIEPHWSPIRPGESGVWFALEQAEREIVSLRARWAKVDGMVLPIAPRHKAGYSSFFVAKLGQYDVATLHKIVQGTANPIVPEVLRKLAKLNIVASDIGSAFLDLRRYLVGDGIEGPLGRRDSKLSDGEILLLIYLKILGDFQSGGLPLGFLNPPQTAQFILDHWQRGDTGFKQWLTEHGEYTEDLDLDKYLSGDTPAPADKATAKKATKNADENPKAPPKKRRTKGPEKAKSPDKTPTKKTPDKAPTKKTPDKTPTKKTPEKAPTKKPEKADKTPEKTRTKKTEKAPTKESPKTKTPAKKRTPPPSLEWQHSSKGDAEIRTAKLPDGSELKIQKPKQSNVAVLFLFEGKTAQPLACGTLDEMTQFAEELAQARDRTGIYKKARKRANVRSEKPKPATTQSTPGERLSHLRSVLEREVANKYG